MNTTSILNGLIETLKDGQEGFRAAADNVESPDLRALFHDFSMQRAQFANELQGLARTCGEHDPEDSGSVAGTLHRGWINIKSAFTTHDDHAVLAECERGEDSAVAEFEKALGEPNLPGNIAAVVRSQYSQVKAAHDRVRDLRDSYAVQ
jgi:uncharacterized protein (TIGR02284 family)